LENLLTVEEARQKILQEFSINHPVLIPLNQSLGKILSQDIFAVIDLPPFNNSSMDGFAVLASDVRDASGKNPVELKIIEDISAGKSPKLQIVSGMASRIMTGAPLPIGADAVVPVELTNFYDRYYEKELPESIQVIKSVLPGDYVRPKGQDVIVGEKMFSKGHKLRPQDLGLLAAQGMDIISCIRQPVVALLSSGDELLQPGEKLQPGKIFDSNTVTIRSLLESFGAKVIDLGVARDNIKDIKEKLNKLENCTIDLLISTAGVSVGVYDFIREVILEEGDLYFWKVNIRPGKPLTFGHYKSIPFLGLPGNPVSAFVSTIVFIKPVINKLLGISELIEKNSAVLAEEINSDGRESYLRAEIKIEQGNYVAKLAGHQGSGNVFSLVYANALLIIPAGVKSLPKGQMVKFFWI